MYLVINNCVTAVKVSNFSGHYLRNRSIVDIGVLGYIGILQNKEHPPEVWHILPRTPVYIRIRPSFCVLKITSYPISDQHAQTFPAQRDISLSMAAGKRDSQCKKIGKGKGVPRNRPGVAQRVPGGLGFQISRHSAHEDGEVVRLTHRPPLPQECFLCLFSLGADSIPGTWYGRKEICH